MKILLVRHAEPDYTIDSLTPKGRREAELLSRRLCKLDVKNFYVSPQGRARDTASYTLSKLNRTAEVLPWLAEFRGRCFNPAEGRQDIPWDYRPREWNAHPEFYQPDAWLKNPQVQDGTVQAIWDETVAGFGRFAGTARLSSRRAYLSLRGQQAGHAGILLSLWHQYGAP